MVYSLIGKMIRITADDDGKYFKVGDIATIIRRDAGDDYWAEFEDGNDWCIGDNQEDCPYSFEVLDDA